MNHQNINVQDVIAIDVTMIVDVVMIVVVMMIVDHVGKVMIDVDQIIVGDHH